MKDILKKAKAEGRTQVETEDGAYCLHWVDKRIKGTRETIAVQTWVFVPYN